MILTTRQQRERFVLDLYYNQGKNRHEIVQEIGISVRDIGAILNKSRIEEETEEQQEQKLSLSNLKTGRTINKSLVMEDWRRCSIIKSIPHRRRYFQK